MSLAISHNNDIDTFARMIRRLSLYMIYQAGSGHPGGSLSCADLLASLYLQEGLAQQPAPAHFVLSKGHACPALYGAAVGVGILPVAEISGFRRIKRLLQGHPSVKHTPWVVANSGSLGQGFSVAVGMAQGLVLQNKRERVYAMLGDGEMQEGEVWEAAMFAAHKGLDNLCVIIDYNKMQSDDLNENIIGLEPLVDKWRAFGWHVLDIDGHSNSQIRQSLLDAKGHKGKPTVIIAHTIKGKGVSYMENSPLWHGSVKLKEDEYKLALSDLGIAGSEMSAWLATGETQ